MKPEIDLAVRELLLLAKEFERDARIEHEIDTEEHDYIANVKSVVYGRAAKTCRLRAARLKKGKVK